jgi:tol-pal system protein YbgF
MKINSNSVRTLALALLVSVAAPVAATSAPVTEVGAGSTTVDRLERMLQARNQMQLDMQRQLDQMAQELSTLRGNVERNSYEIKQVVERQRDLYREVDTLRTAKQATPAPKDTAKDASPVSFTDDKSENAAYEAAVNLILKEKDYQGATKAFKAFLAQYPESVYTANAHYWLGQLYFSKNNFEQANQEFTAVSEFKDSNKRADALLKLGLIAQKEGNGNQAKQYFQQVIDTYPDSTSAKQAKNAM